MKHRWAYTHTLLAPGSLVHNELRSDARGTKELPRSARAIYIAQVLTAALHERKLLNALDGVTHVARKPTRGGWWDNDLFSKRLCI